MEVERGTEGVKAFQYIYRPTLISIQTSFAGIASLTSCRSRLVVVFELRRSVCSYCVLCGVVCAVLLHTVACLPSAGWNSPAPMRYVRAADVVHAMAIQLLLDRSLYSRTFQATHRAITWRGFHYSSPSSSHIRVRSAGEARKRRKEVHPPDASRRLCPSILGACERRAISEVCRVEEGA